jgi:hypothetical protein
MLSGRVRPFTERSHDRHVGPLGSALPGAMT